MSELKKLDNKVSAVFYAISAILLTLIVLSFNQIDDDKAFYDDYCINVAIWESDADAGISPYDRAGYPNYKEINCEQ